MVNPFPPKAADGENFSFTVLSGEAYGEIMLAEKECLFLQSQKTSAVGQKCVYSHSVMPVPDHPGLDPGPG